MLTLQQTSALFKAVPRLPDGRPDWRSPEWKRYMAALSAKGIAYQERRLQKHFRTAVASIVHDAQAYLQDLVDSASVVQ